MKAPDVEEKKNPKKSPKNQSQTWKENKNEIKTQKKKIASCFSFFFIRIQ